MENIGVGLPFSAYGDLSMERYPVWFMEGVHQDITRHALIHKLPMQSPARPNLTSTEAVTGEEKKRDKEEDDDEEEEYGEKQQHKRTKGFKSEKSTNKTKTRAPKVSFITKSEVLHLEDGYKWRKYGQKPVKNSPFPRHYYRCTISWCDVKKRVERSFNDPSTVITTYEGQHTHPRPLIMSKTGSFGSTALASGSHFGLPTLPPQLRQLFHYNSQQQQDLSDSGTNYVLKRQENDDLDHDEVIKNSRSRDLLDETGLVKDNGLLQDVVSSHIIKQ